MGEWGQYLKGCLLKYLKGCHLEDGRELFQLAPEDRTYGNGFKLRVGRCWLDIRKNIFYSKSNDWIQLFREVMSLPSIYNWRMDEY